MAESIHLPYYHVGGIIGQGGAGVVYEAVDMRSGYRVAIKSLYKSKFKDEAIRRKFKTEANHYLYLEHPNIVALKDFIASNEMYYLVMEYVEGFTLDQYVANTTGPIPQERAVVIFVQLLAAIEHAHKQGVIHLDIKPGNVMITHKGIVKVLDFGISLTKDPVYEDDAKIYGTPLYMSPEQVTRNATIDLRTDIYSLGVTLFQIVTGMPPYSGITRHTLVQKIKTEPLPRAQQLYPFVSDQMQAIIDKATKKLPELRFQSCEEFQMALMKLTQ